MSTSNKVPPIDDEKTVKTLSFPFKKGRTGFPEVSMPQNYTFNNIISLLMTRRFERVMLNELGVGVDEYVFENMGPLQSVRLANLVSNAIEVFVPGVIVNKVIPSQLEYQSGEGSSIVFDIEYTVKSQVRQQQVIYSPNDRGANQTVSD